MIKKEELEQRQQDVVEGYESSRPEVLWHMYQYGKKLDR